MNSEPAETSYSGRDNLEAMKQATRYNDFLVTLIRKFASGETTLDHGAGAGTFARRLASTGLKVLCMEPDKRLREELAASGFEVAATLAEIEEETLDYAYTLNVLEHINDDGEAIAALYRCLKPGGRIFVYVPAFEVLFSQMDAHVGHFRRYRRKSMAQLVSSAGFTVSIARYADSLGFIATLVYKLIGDRSGSVSAGSVAFYDSVVFPVSRVVDFLTFGSFGKNLMIVATKPLDGKKS